MSKTALHLDTQRTVSRRAHLSLALVWLCAACVALLTLAGCSSAPPVASSGGSGSAMAGAGDPGYITVTRAALESTPQPWVLTSPEAAVRSYLDWTSYAYRIGDPTVATATMTATEGVRVDAYNQYNLEQGRLIDQALSSIAFGTASVKGARATLATKETWEYRYVSITVAGQTLSGPFTASYETTYTVLRSKDGDWLVDSVQAQALGDVK